MNVRNFLKYIFPFLMLSAMLLTSCGKKNTSKSGSVFDMQHSSPEKDSIRLVMEEKKRLGKVVGQIIKVDSAILVADKIMLMERFTKEFGDGTVVTDVIIGAVRRDTTQAPRFYLVGQGRKYGRFQIMAFELFSSDDGQLFINRISQKHICKANRCKFCYFTYKGNRIIGCECNDEKSGLQCIHSMNEKNTFY